MLAESNRKRLEKEILHLVQFITDARDVFFKLTGFSADSPDEYLNNWKSKDVFAASPELVQLELNIQLLYIKLSSYYQLQSEGGTRRIRTPRNAFAHELTNLIFGKKVNYNFFLHKVSKNLKKVQYIFYQEDGNTDTMLSKTLELDLGKDIMDFLTVWALSRKLDSTI